MATYAELSETDANVLDSHNNNLRGFVSELARLMQKAVVIDDNWDAQVSAIVTTLDAAAVIPDNGGLACAADMTKEEMQSIMTSVANLLSTYNTNAARQLYVKLAGPNNVL